MIDIFIPITHGVYVNGPNRRFTFLMDMEMYAALQALAGHCGGSVSGLIRDTLERMLGQYYACGGTVGAVDIDGGGKSSDVPV